MQVAHQKKKKKKDSSSVSANSDSICSKTDMGCYTIVIFPKLLPGYGFPKRNFNEGCAVDWKKKKNLFTTYPWSDVNPVGRWVVLARSLSSPGQRLPSPQSRSQWGRWNARQTRTKYQCLREKYNIWVTIMNKFMKFTSTFKLLYAYLWLWIRLRLFFCYL